MRSKIIAIGGLSGHGKSTLAHILQQEAQHKGWHVHQLAFADPLKSIVRIVQQDFVNKNPNHLQATSDQWKSDYGVGCFAKDLIARIKAHHQTVPSYYDKLLYIVPDVRFIVELNALSNLAATGYELTCVRVVRPSFMQTDRNMLHASEQELLDVQYEDYRIEADDMDQLIHDGIQLWGLINEQ